MKCDKCGKDLGRVIYGLPFSETQPTIGYEHGWTTGCWDRKALKFEERSPICTDCRPAPIRVCGPDPSTIDEVHTVILG